MKLVKLIEKSRKIKQERLGKEIRSGNKTTLTT